DRLGLAALLGVDARKGAGRVDERDHRQAEAVGELHEPHRLAVALRPRHAEIVPEAALGVGALLLADDAHRLALEPAEPADDRLVLAEIAVASQRREFRDEAFEIIRAARPFLLPGDLGLLPRRQAGVEF